MWASTIRAAFVAAVLVTGVTAVAVHDAPPVIAEEDAVARSLFDSGKAALSKKKYDEAIRFFQKALDESDLLIEASYWEAQAHEKLKQSSAALTAYRRFLSGYTEKQALAEVTKTETALEAKAKKRVEKLAAGERALDALQKTFVDKLMLFAVANENDDPGVARDALRHILSIDPDHADARDKWTALGGKDDEGGVAEAGPPPPGPFARLKTKPWHDLIARKSLGTKNSVYRDGTMFVDTKGGKVMTPVERIRTGSRYVVDLDFRVLEEHETTWLTGVVVGWEGEEFYGAFTQRGQVVINRGDARTGPQEDVDFHPMKPIDPKRWHRLSLRVEGNTLVVWFDGEVVCHRDLGGDVGLLLGDQSLRNKLL